MLPGFKSTFQSLFIISMVVERMEVLEYRQQFEVKLSTFSDSTNTETPRKLAFSLTCVCVYMCVCEGVCESVCVCVCLSACLSVCLSVFLSVCLISKRVKEVM